MHEVATKATAPDEIVEVATAFSGPLGTFRKGELYRSDDPVVRKYPQFFRPMQIRSTVKAPRIEQATAAPGEKRGA
jgi:hypothetical protein